MSELIGFGVGVLFAVVVGLRVVVLMTRGDAGHPDGDFDDGPCACHAAAREAADWRAATGGRR